jgi:hypothetical protein
MDQSNNHNTNMSRLAQVRETYIASSVNSSVSEQDIKELVEKVMIQGAACLGQRQMLMECNSSRFVERITELIRDAVRDFEYPALDFEGLTDSSLYL